jgi:hypothetical protein
MQTEMSVIKQLQKDCGGQWLYVKLTHKGETMWRNQEGRIAMQAVKKGSIVVFPMTFREQ